VEDRSIYESEYIVQERASPNKNSRIVKQGNLSGRYLRTAQPYFPSAPSLAELEVSPYKVQPKQLKSSIIMAERKADSKLRTPGRFSPMELDPKLVNVEPSADLGELKKYAEDNEMFHPEMYDEGDDPMKGPPVNILGSDAQGRGVFDKSESSMNKRDNLFVPPAQMNNRNPNSQSAIVPPDQDELDEMQVNNSKMSQIIKQQMRKNN